MSAISVLILLAGLLRAARSGPWIRRQIPPHLDSGFRTEAAFESPERCCAIKAYLGRLLLKWALLPLLPGLAGFVLAAEWRVE
jgi:hypothetical protein